ncbi:hypothetical protein NVP1022O_31 [Vibrio phage 1.022.O._10N.286.45.A10]|nr:hypothetical protein NVP1022O_31 [Vibrio phage 1.022.O._10N.286.45.A10]
MTRIKLVDISKPYYAARRFTMDGIEYQQDDRVPFDGLNERDITRLIKSTYVTSVEPKKAVETVKATPVVEPVKVVTEPVVDANARTGKLAHVGGGQYEVQDEDGKNMLPEKVKGKDMAKMAASQFGITVTE